MPASLSITIIIAASVGGGIVALFIAGICVWTSLDFRKQQKYKQARDERQQAHGEEEANNHRIEADAKKLILDRDAQWEQWRQKLVDQERLLAEAKKDEAHRYGIEIQGPDPKNVADRILAASNREFIDKKRAEGGEAEADLQLLAATPEDDDLYPDDSYSNAGLVVERAQFRDRRLGEVWNSKQAELMKLYENQKRFMEIEKERYQLMRRQSVLESAGSRAGSPIASGSRTGNLTPQGAQQRQIGSTGLMLEKELSSVSPSARSNTSWSKGSKGTEIEVIPLRNLTPISATGTRSQTTHGHFVNTSLPPILPRSPSKSIGQDSPIPASLRVPHRHPRSTMFSSISKLELAGDSEVTGPEYVTNFADYETTITQDPWRSEAARNYAAQRCLLTRTLPTFHGDVVAQLMQEDSQRQFMERIRSESEEAENSRKRVETEEWDGKDKGKERVP